MGVHVRLAKFAKNTFKNRKCGDEGQGGAKKLQHNISVTLAL
jgi:hypothetical protein